MDISPNRWIAFHGYDSRNFQRYAIVRFRIDATHPIDCVIRFFRHQLFWHSAFVLGGSRHLGHRL